VKLAVVLLAVACSSDKPPLVGPQCTTDNQCAQFCAGPDAWPSGFCTFVCTFDGECGTNEYCVVIDNSGRGSLCGIACGSDADCDSLGSNYHCEAASRKGAVGSINICFGG
jgi:hypothetical protein